MTTFPEAEKSYNPVIAFLWSTTTSRWPREDYYCTRNRRGPLANRRARVCIGSPGRAGYAQEAGGVGGGTEVVLESETRSGRCWRKRTKRGENRMYPFLGGSLPFHLVRQTDGRWAAPPQYPSLSSNALDDLQSDLTILLETVPPIHLSA